MPIDDLTRKLDSIVSSIDSELTPDEYFDPPTLAGGVQLMQILDLPQAATPDAFKLPPPSDEEAAALAAIARSLSLSQDDIAGFHGEPVRSTVQDTTLFESMVPRHPAPAKPAKPAVTDSIVPVLYSDTYHPFIENVVPGRNRVPSGHYRMRIDSTLRFVSLSDSGVQPSAADYSLSSSVADMRTVCALTALNNLQLGFTDSDRDSYFLCLTIHPETGTPAIALALVADIDVVRPVPDDRLITSFTSATRSLYGVIQGQRQLQHEPVPFQLKVTRGKVSPSRVVESSFTSPPIDAVAAVAPLVLGPSLVNEDDGQVLAAAFAELASLDNLRRTQLSIIAGIAAKYTR